MNGMADADGNPMWFTVPTSGQGAFAVNGLPFGHELVPTVACSVAFQYLRRSEAR